MSAVEVEAKDAHYRIEVLRRASEGLKEIWLDTYLRDVRQQLTALLTTSARDAYDGKDSEPMDSMKTKNRLQSLNLRTISPLSYYFSTGSEHATLFNSPLRTINWTREYHERTRNPLAVYKERLETLKTILVRTISTFFRRSNDGRAATTTALRAGIETAFRALVKSCYQDEAKAKQLLGQMRSPEAARVWDP
ncbi:MAG: hypothetical protein M1816_006477 [Peltula sp. TS41687]|nr:MAG: hypothetical protein M1816_006477 [Peltula sp. TS41687]